MSIIKIGQSCDLYNGNNSWWEKLYLKIWSLSGNCECLRPSQYKIISHDKDKTPHSRLIFMIKSTHMEIPSLYWDGPSTDKSVLVWTKGKRFSLCMPPNTWFKHKTYLETPSCTSLPALSKEFLYVKPGVAHCVEPGATHTIKYILSLFRWATRLIKQKLLKWIAKKSYSLSVYFDWRPFLTHIMTNVHSRSDTDLCKW